MPELPEVETIRVGLSALLPGKTVRGETHNWPKSFPNSKADVQRYLIGAKVVDVTRRGKVLIIGLSTKYSLVIHLKMTGQLVYRGKSVGFGGGHPTDSLVGQLPDKSTRVVLSLDSGKLFFNDQRKFGWMRLLPTAEVPSIDFFKKIGPEPLSASFTSKEFMVRMRHRANTSVKAALLDQTVVAGVGNIYADESLYAAKIHPATLVKNLSDQKLQKLLASLIEVLTLAIKKGGSTDRNYVNHEGKKGNYLNYAKVFRKNGQPCRAAAQRLSKLESRAVERTFVLAVRS